jgi:hypothetical protein
VNCEPSRRRAPPRERRHGPGSDTGQDRSKLQAPGTEVEVAPLEGHRAGVVAGSGGERALRLRQQPPAQGHGKPPPGRSGRPRRARRSPPDYRRSPHEAVRSMVPPRQPACSRLEQPARRGQGRPARAVPKGPEPSARASTPTLSRLLPASPLSYGPCPTGPLALHRSSAHPHPCRKTRE